MNTDVLTLMIDNGIEIPPEDALNGLLASGVENDINQKRQEQRTSGLGPGNFLDETDTMVPLVGDRWGPYTFMEWCVDNGAFSLDFKDHNGDDLLRRALRLKSLYWTYHLLRDAQISESAIDAPKVAPPTPNLSYVPPFPRGVAELLRMFHQGIPLPVQQ
jgi:hypothetical protein